MLKVPFDKTVNLFPHISTNRFRSRIFHPGGRKLFGVEFSGFVVPTPLVSIRSTSMTFPAHWDANLLNDSSTMSHFANPLRMQLSARVFNAGTSYWVRVCQLSSNPCQWGMRHGLYLQVDRWTSGMVEGPYRQGDWRFLRFEIDDSHLTQTVQNLSRSCRGTSKMLGTWNDINELKMDSIARTHVTSAISGILTTFPLLTLSSRISHPNVSSPGIAKGSDGGTSDLTVCLSEKTFLSSSSSRSLSDRYP